MKLCGRSAFSGELNLTYRIEPRALNLTANGKWAHSNEIPTYTQSGSLAAGDTLSVILLEDGHSVTFSSVTVRSAGGTDVTTSYKISLTDGIRHIPSDDYLCDSSSHYKTCIFGCADAIVNRGEHRFSEDGVCSVCDFELPNKDSGEKSEEITEESEGNVGKYPVKLTVISAIFGGAMATIALIYYLYKRKI